MRRNEQGAVVVELALVLPILVMFVFGIIEFGLAYNAKIELTAAVREGARAAALGGTTVTAAQVEQKTRDAAPGLVASQIVVTGGRCDANPLPPNTSATITASYPYTYDIPFVGKRSTNLRATGVMRCGG